MLLSRWRTCVVVVAAVSVAATLGILGIVWVVRPPEPGAPTRKARHIVATLRAMPSSPLRWEAAEPAPPTEARRAPNVPVAKEQRPVQVTLPGHSTEPLRLEVKATGMAVEVRPLGVRDVVAQSAYGYYVYPHANADGGTLLHRIAEDGAEDFVSFETRPAKPEVAYDLKLDKGVAGLRLVEGTLELLDADGAPRLRAAPPFIAGADGVRTDATLAVEGCTIDTNPAGPWGRAVTAPGTGPCTLRVRWSDEAVQYPAVLDPKWITTGSLSVARQDHNLINLPLTGKVLAVGGRSSPTGTTGLVSAEIFDKTTGTWSVTGSMTGGRWSASATLLNSSSNGTTSQRVLVAGGINGTTSLNTAQLYNQTAGTWAAAGNLNAPRHLHTATLLADGRVLVAGGQNGTTVLQSAALYNPASGSGLWTATTGPIPPPGWRFGSATLIQTSNTQLNNKVLLAGGNDGTHSLSSVFLFDPVQSAFSTLASMPSAREGGKAVVLSGGRILIAGGKSGSTTLASAVIFDPAVGPGSWSTTGNMTSPRWGHAINMLPTGVTTAGQVIVSGGSNGTSTLNSTEIWNGSTWALDGAMVAPVQQHASVALGNSLLIAGGSINNGSTTVNAAELYDPSVGLSCSSGSQCASGFCVAGVCCDTACSASCGACNLPGMVGTCSRFTYAVPQPDLTAPRCSDGTAPVGCRAFDCDAGTDAGTWLATPACTGSYPACTQACPSSGCKLSTQSPGHSGDIVTCSCSCTDPSNGPLVVSATGCVPPSGGTAACSSLCGSVVDPCGGAAGCSIGSCTSSGSPATVTAGACNPTEGLLTPVTAVADWSAAVNSNASQMTLTVGASQTHVPVSGTIKFNATASRIEIVSLDLGAGTFTFFGRNVSVPQAHLLSRASGTRSVPDPDNPSGPTAINVAASAALIGLSGTLSGTPNATQVLNTAPITGVFDPGAGTITLAGHFVAGSGVADINVLANINNRPPQARTNGDQTVVCTGSRMGSVFLDGRASSDVDGVISRYQWLATNAALLRPTKPVATAATASATLNLPLGQNHVVLNVYDDKLATSQASVTINVVDSTPPALISPGDVVVYVGEASSAIVNLGFPGVADACDPHPAVGAVWLLDGETTVNQPIPDPKHAVLPVNSHVIRWFVTDAGGNTATVDQSVEVNAGSGVDVPPTLQAPPTCPDPPPTSTTPVALDVRVCVFGRMNLTTNTREGTAAWASCANDQCVIDNLNALFADANAVWSDTVAFNVVGFKVIADPCPPGYTDSSCVSACGGATPLLPDNYGDICNFDARHIAPPGYENLQSVHWCQQAWGFQPSSGPFDQCERGLVAVIGNKVVSGLDCAFGDNGSPHEGQFQGTGLPNLGCDDPTKINNNDQGAYATFTQTEPSCPAHTLAHELGHALGMHHGDGVDNDCNGVWDDTCDTPEFNASDCRNGSISLMCDGATPNTILTNLQKNRLRVFASRTPTSGGITPGQNCGTVVPPPLPINAGKPTVQTSGGCGCSTASPGSGLLTLPIVLGVVITYARRSRRRRESTKQRN